MLYCQLLCTYVGRGVGSWWFPTGPSFEGGLQNQSRSDQEILHADSQWDGLSLQTQGRTPRPGSQECATEST